MSGANTVGLGKETLKKGFAGNPVAATPDGGKKEKRWSANTAEIRLGFLDLGPLSEGF